MPWYSLVTIAVSAAMSVLMLYQIVIGVFSLRKPRQIKPGSYIHRFALVVSARNEELVIGNLIDSLIAQDYPRESYDIFVIADNCSDHTGAAAEAKGARVFVRNDTQHVGKGFALGWFFQHFLNQYRGQYEAIAIFDADNLVDRGFLVEMNAQLCAGEVAVMGYRDSKNPYDNIVSATLSMSFWFVSRFYLYPRYQLGLTSPASGTGYVFLAKLIDQGWHTGTICEDLEFTLQLALQGERIGYTSFARFYDEQPVNLKISLIQRFRWAVGCYQNVRRYAVPLMHKKPVSSVRIRYDMLIYLLFQPACSLQLLVTIVNIVCILLVHPFHQWYAWLYPLLVPSVIGLAGMYLQTVLILSFEHKWSWRILPGALVFPFFLVSNAFVYLLAMFRRTVFWHPIVHKRSMDMNQLNRK